MRTAVREENVCASFRLVCVLAMLLVGGCMNTEQTPGSGIEPRAGVQVEVQSGASYDHLLYLPEAYEAGGSFPLLLFLHGAGERGEDLARVKAHGPPKLIEAGQHLPFIVVSPLAPQGGGWNSGRLSLLLDKVSSELAVDSARVYVTGLSMGGFGTWALAAHSPDRFAAIVPICGGGDAESGEALIGIPGIWAFHGGQDEVVPRELSEEMIEAVRNAGGRADLTIYPDAGHDSWTETYADPGLFSWLLRHSRVRQEDS